MGSRHRAACAHRSEQEQAPGVRCQQDGWFPDLRRVVVYWSCRLSYPPCARWWYQSFRPGSFRKHVPWWTHVRPDQDLAQVALAEQPAGAPLRRLLRPRGLGSAGSRHGPWPQDHEVPELPLVLSSAVENTTKTGNAMKILKAFACDADVDHVKDSKKVRRGKGKMRNRRYTMRRGPLIIYNSDQGLTKAFRNIPGIEICHVSRLNLLQLAPGGHLGRFCVWTEGAFGALNKIFGTFTKVSEAKKGFKLPYPMMANADLARVINSDEVQAKVNPAKESKVRVVHKKNPLKNLGHMIKLNPYAKTLRRMEPLAEEARTKKKAEILENKRKGTAPAPDAAAVATQKKRTKFARAQFVKMTN